MSFTAIPGSYTPDGKEMIPRNCLWLDTKYWSFVWTFNGLAINFSSESVRFTVHELDCEFYFRISKTTSTVFSVELHRVLKDPNERPDDGFVLHLILSVVGLRRQPKNKYMNSSTDCLLVSYDISNLDLNKPVCWIIKCGFEMCEFTSLDNEAFRKQNTLLVELVERKKNMRKNLARIAYLLNRSDLKGVFSGRQTYEFAMAKFELIERSIDFAEDILESILEQSTSSLHPFQRRTLRDLILGYVYAKELRLVEDREILHLYTKACCYGLLALRRECMRYLKNTLEDTEFLLHVLVVCDVQCDYSSLMYTALAEFAKRKAEILQSDKLRNFIDKNILYMQSVLDTLICVKMWERRRARQDAQRRSEEDGNEHI